MKIYKFFKHWNIEFRKLMRTYLNSKASKSLFVKAHILIKNLKNKIYLKNPKFKIELLHFAIFKSSFHKILEILNILNYNIVVYNFQKLIFIFDFFTIFKSRLFRISVSTWFYGKWMYIAAINYIILTYAHKNLH